MYEGSWIKIDFAYQLCSCMWDYLKSTRDKVRMPHMCTWPRWCLESEARCLTAVSDWSTEQRQDLPIFKGITYRLLISAIWSSIFFLDCFRVKIFGEEYVVISRLARIFYYILYVIKAVDVVISSGNTYLTENQVFRLMTPTEGDQQGLFKADGIQTSIIGSWYIWCYLMRAEDGLQASWNPVGGIWWQQGSQIR